MIGATLALLAAIVPAAPDTVPASAAPVATRPADCPPPKLYPPRYPVQQLRNDIGGLVRVLATIDACGRVQTVDLVASSGVGKLDEAALEAVSGFVLGEATVARAVDGRVVVPIEFGGLSNVHLQPIDWPASHARPGYSPDPEPITYSTIADFEGARRLRTDKVLKSPYAVVPLKDGGIAITWIQRDAADASTWWLGYVLHQREAGKPNGAFVPRKDALVRYRLGTDAAGAPDVRVAMLCERPEAECATLRDFFMKGLPFAKPR